MKKDETKETLKHEWSYPVAVEDISEDAVIYDISPGEEEKKALAERFGISSVDTLSASMTVTREQGGMVIHVHGQLDAELTQACVVTLVPLKAQVSEEFDAWYTDPESTILLAKARHERQAGKGRGEKPMLEEFEDPEHIVNGEIDLGELAAQYLSLAIDPYPHAEGLEAEAQVIQDEREIPDSLKNPFAALKEWKDRQR